VKNLFVLGRVLYQTLFIWKWEPSGDGNMRRHVSCELTIIQYWYRIGNVYYDTMYTRTLHEMKL